jgi:pimeloyl-ACP methyl ester carboxylesterase
MEMLDADLAQAIVLRASDRPLFGLHNRPAGPVQRDVAFVLCSPFGYESLITHRAYRHIAEALAQKGFHVLRFDYYGMGNSSGTSESAAACSDDVAAAIDELKARTGVQSVCLFGVRAGALFALKAAASRADVRSLALWATPASGRAHVRELVAFEKVSGEPSEGPELRIAGFLLSDATQAELRSIHASASPSPRALDILALCRDDIAGEEKLARSWSDAGHRVVSTTVPGYVEMMTWTETSVVPTQAIAALCEWATRVHEAVSPIQREGDAGLHWLFSEDVREAGVRFGPNGRLFGVLSLPTSAASQPLKPTFVIANTGANHHVGNGRLGVTLARSLAQQGFSVLRFDASGIGESHASPGRIENELYAHDAAFSVSEALRYLHTQHRLDSFVLMGICAGAYATFRSALIESRVVGQILVNLAIFEPEGAAAFAGGTRSASFKTRKVYLEQLLDPNTWRRLFEGRVAVGPILRHLLKQARRQLESTGRARLDALLKRGAPTDPVELDFRTLGRRGARTLMVYGDEDASLEALSIFLGSHAERMRNDANFSLQLVPNADHTFTRAGAQRRLQVLVEAFMRDLAR